MKVKVLLACMVIGSISILSGCQGNSDKEVYFLNFKPEIADTYKKIAEEYEKETGIKVKVVTAASGTYEQTLKSEIAKSNPPTIFQINGPVGYQNWSEYCLNIEDSKLYNHLIDPSLAVADKEGVYGIPYVVEGYGIIYNKAIFDKYVNLEDKKTLVKSVDDIKSYETLKSVVEDMTAHKSELGIEGVFASTSLKVGEQWRWQTHLANIPFYYEFKENTKYTNPILAGLSMKEIAFKYDAQYKNIFDLYINNSCSERNVLGGKTVDDSMAEFALGKAAMVQNGNWAWGQIKGISGNVVKEEDIKFMPIYTGVEGEEKQGLSIGTENYFCINSKVSKEKQKQSLAFLEWLFSSEKGKSYVTKELGFIAPFNTFKENEKPEDPLAKEVMRWMGNGSVTVPWTFAAFPSEQFKNDFGNALLEYAQEQKEWSEVTEVVKTSWKKEVDAKE